MLSKLFLIGNNSILLSSVNKTEHNLELSHCSNICSEVMV